jgi:putative tricarboxylic transport membrane protein
LLAALSLNGFVPGPHLVSESPELFYAVVAGLLGSSLFIIITGWAMARGMVKLLTINRSVVIVLSIATVVLGVYSLQFRVLDVALCFAAAGIGYFMLRYGYSTAAAALAVVLAAGFEASLRRGLSVFSEPSAFFGRPITIVILVMAALFLVIGIRRTMKVARQERELVLAQHAEGESAHTPPDAEPSRTTVEHTAPKED